jgi:hypothetical protein
VFAVGASTETAVLVAGAVALLAAAGSEEVGGGVVGRDWASAMGEHAVNTRDTSANRAVE